MSEQSFIERDHDETPIEELNLQGVGAGVSPESNSFEPEEAEASAEEIDPDIDEEYPR